MALKFPPSQRSGDVTYKAAGLSVGYPGKVVFTDADIEIKRGEKVALVGRNGEGKTTLIRAITGELQPLAGESKVGHNVSIGYFAQNQEDVLDKKETVWSTLDRIAVGDVRTKLRDILAAFLFRGEDIDKRVSVLSGGERARLGMAKLMLQSHNFLLLDEPTNHMDIQSKDVLKRALQSYDGTLLVVSHDRDFLEGLVDKIYEFRSGRVREHLGGVQEFLERHKLESLQELERKGSIAEGSERHGRPDRPSGFPVEAGNDRNDRKAGNEGKKTDYEASKARARESRKIRDRISWLEHEIGKLETRMQAIEAVLQAPSPSDDIIELTREYLECKRDLDAKTEEWGSLL
jgi:ATP-binding cassette subfamily F protein 3